MVGERSEPRSPGPGYLERACLDPGDRACSLRRALEAFVREAPVSGTALVRPGTDGASPWQAVYAGASRMGMERWLRLRLQASLKDTAMALGEGPPCPLGVGPVSFSLCPRAPLSGGMWLVWPLGGSGLAGEEVEHFRRGLESLVEVEQKERLFFRGREDPLDPELAQALRSGDEGALPALLSLVRTVGDADLSYWGSVRDDAIEVEWHLGARDGGFGFELPLGQGVGGRAFAGGRALEIPDYRNCRYRYPGVSDATDGEEVRSTLAIPVRGVRNGGVLYAARRKVAPFSPAESALLHRLAHAIEPLPGLWPASRRFSAAGEDRYVAMRAELREILLHCAQAREVESWTERLVRGPAILADDEGRPYVSSNDERFERLRASPDREPRVVPLGGGRQAGGRGHLYLWPRADLAPAGWPDLLEDVVSACNVVLDRAEQARDRINRLRSRWLGDVLEGKTDRSSCREGKRLGLPVDRGEAWAIAWEPAYGAEQTRLETLAEDVLLDKLSSPLVMLDKGVGVLLLEGRAQREPQSVRDGLLRFLGPSPLWLAHGASYGSFEALKDASLRVVRAVRRARREGAERYVSGVGGWGLESLLENPGLLEELDSFAKDLLAPLLAYDEGTGSRLTQTFCLVLTSGSAKEAAKRLFIHENTARYRMRRAEQILGRDLGSPKERTAVSLAAFVWSRNRAGPSG